MTHHRIALLVLATACAAAQPAAGAKTRRVRAWLTPDKSVSIVCAALGGMYDFSTPPIPLVSGPGGTPCGHAFLVPSSTMRRAKCGMGDFTITPVRIEGTCTGTPGESYCEYASSLPIFCRAPELP